jgi:DNA-binding GntR family transcriptional regulator
MSESVTDQQVDVLWGQIRDEVEGAWADVFKIVNSVIEHDDRFGFKLIESKINPSFQDILLSLRMMEALLDVLPTDDYSMYRMVLNAKQQINHIEQVVTAVKHNAQDDYTRAMAKLRSQAQF